MKFLASLLTATALLSSCISALPLTEDHILALRVDNGKDVDNDKKTQTTQNTENSQSPGAESKISKKKIYDIEEVFKEWFGDPKVQETLGGMCLQDGGWEGWAQVELDKRFRKFFGLHKKTRIREFKVYNGKRKAADFLLPETDEYDGMILELKCENKNTNSGEKLKDLVEKDIKKEKGLKPAYKTHSFRVIAMAWSEEAETAIEGLGLEVIPDIEAEMTSSSDSSEGDESGKESDKSSNARDILRIYQKIISTGSAGDGVDEITQGIGSLSTGDKNEDKNTDNDGTGNTKSDLADTGEATAGEASTGKTKTGETNTKGSKKAGGKKESGKKDSGKKDSGKKDNGKKGGSGEGTSGTS